MKRNAPLFKVRAFFARLFLSLSILLGLIMPGNVFPALAYPHNTPMLALPADFSDSLVASVGGPTAFDFTPDGRMLITTQGGTVRVYQNNSLVATAALNLSSKVCSNSERGLLGVTVDPDFSSNSFIYLYYTFKKFNTCNNNASDSPINRVSRFILGSNNIVDPATEVVIVDNIPAPNGNHNAGDLQFGKDGFLYISAGDGGCQLTNTSACGGSNQNARRQDILSGKILRVDTNGKPASGNPWLAVIGARRCGDPAGVPAGTAPCQETFVWGLRNPFRFGFDPNASTTRFFINDVGQGAWEEIDEAQIGADYGWNIREGNCVNNSTSNCGVPPAGLTNPIHAYGRGEGCASITGGAFVPNGIWPASYTGAYLFSDFSCGRIFSLTPSGSGGYTAGNFATGLGNNTAVHLAFGPYNATQALYYTTYANGGEVRRIVYTGKPVWSGSAVISADRSIVAVGRPHIGDEIATYGGINNGATNVFFPMVFKNMWGYNSALTVQNTSGPSTANFTVTFRDAVDGSLDCTKTDTLPANASVTYWVPDLSCDSGSLASSWYGAAVIQSTNGVSLAAVTRPHLGSEVTAYNGFTNGSPTAFLPMLFKNQSGNDSAFYIQNLSNSATANITMKFINADGSVACTATDTIAAFSSKGYWVPTQACASGSLPASWAGAAVVTASQPIVTVGRPHLGAQVTTYNGFFSGNSTVYVPMLFKNQWDYNSALYIQNTHPATTATITITFRDVNGNQTCVVIDSLVANSAKGYWLPGLVCNTGSLPGSWYGSAVVQASEPVVAVTRPHLDEQVATYNGFDSGSTTAYLPMLFANSNGNEAAVYVQNIDSQMANVTLRFYNLNGSLACTHTDTIAPFSSKGYWLRDVMCIS